MKKIILLFSVCSLLMLTLCVTAICASGPLLQKKDLIYEGAFRVPKGNLSSIEYSRLGAGGSAILFNPSRRSLFIVGHPYGQMLTEISIPEIVNANNLNELKTAQVLQSPVDITGGNLNKLKLNRTKITNGARIGGFLIFNGKLIGSAYAYYDANGQAFLSHFIASPDWDKTGIGFHGMYRVGLNPINPESANGGFVGGYMCLVPPEWRDALGGPALTGMGAISIISRSSYGPCAWVFNPDDLGKLDPVPATMLVGYPQGHTTLGNGPDPSLYFNRATEIRGLVFPYGTSSVLFFGRHGLGKTGTGDTCYGEGTSDPNLDGKDVPGTDGHVRYCYDPTDGSKGGHGYPYVYRVWVYDANDFLKVKKGVINPDTGKPFKPWDIRPYAIWNLNFPFANENAHILGAAYDASTQRIFISEFGGERPSYEYYPIIHVYKINIPSGSGTVPPPPGPLHKIP